MSSAITSLNSSSQINVHQQRRDEFKQDFKALDQAMQSGDLQAAQNAFSKLQQGEQNKGGGRASANGGSNPMQKDFEALSSALSSGDIKSAQDAFSTIKQNMQAHQAEHSQSMAQTPPPMTDSRSGASAKVYA